MDDREKKLEEIRIAKVADKTMLRGGTDTEPSVVKLSEDGNVTRQIYEAIGHETLQSEPDFENKNPGKD